MKSRMLTCISPLNLLFAAVIALSSVAEAQTFKTIYSFTGGSDGGSPDSGLIRDKTGNLYGITSFGGRGFGTVYRINTRGKENVLYSFSGSSDGAYPQNAPLVRDAKGNLYGTTLYGGDMRKNRSGVPMTSTSAILLIGLSRVGWASVRSLHRPGM